MKKAKLFDIVAHCQFEYEVLPRWNLGVVTFPPSENYSDLPKAAQRYVERIKELVCVSP